MKNGKALGDKQFLFTDMAGRICSIPKKAAGRFSGSVLPEWCRATQSDLYFEADPEAAFGAYGFGWLKTAPNTGPAWFDTRAMLARSTERLRSQGILVKIGFEAEFYLFETAKVEAGLTENSFALESLDMVQRTDTSGSPFRIGYTRMQYRPPPFDRHAGLRHEITEKLAQLGLQIVHHDHEAGPGQQEIAIGPDTPVASCDALSLLKLVTYDSAAQHGLTASFMPMPLSWCPGSGLHVHISATRNGQDLLFDQARRSVSGRAALCNLRQAIPSLAAFTNPSPSGLRRLWNLQQTLGAHPVSGYSDRRSLVRLIRSEIQSVGRVELRFPDASGDPYAMLAAILSSLFIHPPNPMDVPEYMPILGMHPLLEEAVKALKPALEAGGAHPKYAPAYLAFRQREMNAMAMSPSIVEMQLHLGC